MTKINTPTLHPSIGSNEWIEWAEAITDAVNSLNAKHQSDAFVTKDTGRGDVSTLTEKNLPPNLPKYDKSKKYVPYEFDHSPKHKEGWEKERERILEDIQPAVNDFMAAANTLANHVMVNTAREMRENIQYIVNIIRGKTKAELLEK